MLRAVLLLFPLLLGLAPGLAAQDPLEGIRQAWRAGRLEEARQRLRALPEAAAPQAAAWALVLAAGEGEEALGREGQDLARRLPRADQGGLWVAASEELVKAQAYTQARTLLKAGFRQHPSHWGLFYTFAQVHAGTGFLGQALDVAEPVFAQAQAQGRLDVPMQWMRGDLLMARSYRDQKLPDVLAQPGYRFRILHQDLELDLDPGVGRFGAKLSYRLRHEGREATRVIPFSLHPQLEIEAIGLAETDGRPLPIQGRRLHTFDQWSRMTGWCSPVFHLDLGQAIAPGQEVRFTLAYHLAPEAILEQPQAWGRLTVSKAASYAILPYGGLNVVFGLNTASPFRLRIRHPEGFRTAAPGNRLPDVREGDRVMEAFESTLPNIPTFTTALYRPLERQDGRFSVEYLLYPHEAPPAALVDHLFAAAGLFLERFGETGVRNYRVATSGRFHAGNGSAENKGNCIFISDDLLKQAQASREGLWTYAGTLFHELYHAWNLYGLAWEGPGAEWFGEGGASFMQNWAAERLLGAEAARHLRRRQLDQFGKAAAHQARATLDRVGKTGPRESSLIYDYGAMVWEQLRRKLGDDVFLAGLGDFHRRPQRRGSLADLLACWEAKGGTGLAAFLDPWMTANAHFSLTLEGVDTRAQGEGYTTEVTLQVTSDRPREVHTSLDYLEVQAERPVTVPVRITGTGRQVVRFSSPRPPARIQLDPEAVVPRTGPLDLVWKP